MHKTITKKELSETIERCSKFLNSSIEVKRAAKTKKGLRGAIQVRKRKVEKILHDADNLDIINIDLLKKTGGPWKS